MDEKQKKVASIILVGVLSLGILGPLMQTTEARVFETTFDDLDLGAMEDMKFLGEMSFHVDELHFTNNSTSNGCNNTVYFEIYMRDADVEYDAKIVVYQNETMDTPVLEAGFDVSFAYLNMTLKSVDFPPSGPSTNTHVEYTNMTSNGRIELYQRKDQQQGNETVTLTVYETMPVYMKLLRGL